MPSPALQLLLAVVGMIGWMAFTEALIKPLSITLAYGLGPRAAAEGLAAMDRIIPQLLEEGIQREEVEAELRRRLSAATGAEWSPRRLRGLRRLFDPLALLDRNAKP